MKNSLWLSSEIINLLLCICSFCLFCYKVCTFAQMFCCATLSEVSALSDQCLVHPEPDVCPCTTALRSLAEGWMIVTTPVTAIVSSNR